MFEQAGIRAVGTGSAGVAFSHGYRDDEFIPRELMLRAIGEMVRAVDVPVTADILSGLGDTPEAVAATIREVIALGASGVNIEDGSDIGGTHLVDVELHCDKIRAACEAARQAGVDIVVNARTDSYWLKLGDDAERLKVSVERANRYRAAGAHCLFVPGAAAPALIATLVKEIAGPLNILAVPGCPKVAELQALGVRRLSEGSGPMRASMMLTRRIARDLIESGTYARFHDDAIPYPEANALFDAKSPKRPHEIPRRGPQPGRRAADPRHARDGAAPARRRAGQGAGQRPLPHRPRGDPGLARLSAADRPRPRRRGRGRGGRLGRHLGEAGRPRHLLLESALRPLLLLRARRAHPVRAVHPAPAAGPPPRRHDAHEPRAASGCTTTR